MATFDWIPFYSELANKLLQYEMNRPTLLGILQNIFRDIGMKSPFMERGDLMTDVDPFTVFSSFNRGITDENRLAITGGLKTALHVAAPLPTSFDGIPVVNNLSMAFFAYHYDKRRKPDDIDHLWQMAQAAIHYADHPSIDTEAVFIKCFDVVRKQPQVSWNLTMALYWIRPNAYLNLDGRNRDYLAQSGMFPFAVPKAMPTGKDYLEIIRQCNQAFGMDGSEVHTFPELSHMAWVERDDKPEEASNARFARWFAPLLAALRALGGSATPQQVCDRIEQDLHLSPEITEVVHEKTGTSVFRNDVAWARNYLAYEGLIDKAERGIWRLTPDGEKAPMDDQIAGQIISKWVRINAQKRRDKDSEDRQTHYWMYTPDNSASLWMECLEKGIMVVGFDGVGDFSMIPSRKDAYEKCKEVYGPETNPKNKSLAIWQFAHEMQIGDIVYAKIGLSKLVGRGIVMSDYSHDETRTDNRNLREVQWTNHGEWDMPYSVPRKALTDITSYVDDLEKLEAVFAEGGEPVQIPEAVSFDPYTRADFLSEAFLPAEQYDTLCGLIRYKKNVILEGAPGVGKTFIAKRLAYSLMGEKDANRVTMVQFHQSYGYEDFIVGLRPNDKGGFELSKGPFYTFCQKALEDPENDYFFIIDEINRGNLSKIFGELLMLIERDKRGEKYRVKLLYAGETFYVPENVYLIGMMNTADRSLAMMDYALRRRFSFFPMCAAFETERFRVYLEEKANTRLNALIRHIQALNQEIAADESLGKGFEIGHSYFCMDGEATDEWLHQVVEFELIPLLREYWFDDRARVDRWSALMRSALQ
ncbi:AAA family ATPase [Bacillota bacterium Meth-B3]